MLKITNLSKVYKNGKESKLALKDVNISFDNTGLICIVGKSGSGKSTLLNIIGNVLKQTNGTVEFNENSIDLIKTQNYSKNIVSIVLQEDYFVSNFTLGENMELFRNLQNQKSNSILMNKLVHNGDLDTEVLRKPYEVSSGQKQRMSVLRAIYKKSNIILADEPTANLDSETERKIFNLLKIEARNRLVIMVTHNLFLAYEYSDRIIEMNNGTIENDIYPKTANEEDIVRIENDKIYVSNTGDNNIADWIKIRKYLKIKKEVSLRIDNRSKTNSTSSIKEKSNVNNIFVSKNKKVKMSTLFHIFNSSIKNIISTVFWFAIGFSFILSIYFVTSYISNIDESELTYDTFTNNEIIDINYKWILDNEVEVSIPSAYIEQMENNYDTVITQLVNKEDLFLEPNSLVEINEYYDGFNIYGYRFFDYSDLNIIVGSLPLVHEVLISDYQADMYLKYDESINNYNDIIGKDLIFDSQSITISGIIQTDIIKYSTIKYNSFNNINEISELYEEFKIDKYNKYLRLYISKDYKNLYLNSEETKNLTFNDNSFTSNVINMNIYDEPLNTKTIWSNYTDGIYLSDSLYNLLLNEIQLTEDKHSITIDSFNFIISGIVYDSNPNENIIYAFGDSYLGLVSAYYETDEIVTNNLFELVDYLSLNDFTHHTRVSSTVYEIINFSKIISKLSFVIQMSSIAVAFMLLIGFNNRIIDKYRNEIIILRMQGLNYGELSKFFVLPQLIKTISVLFFSMLITNIFIFLLNRWISNSFNIRIEFIKFRFLYFFLIYIIYSIVQYVIFLYKNYTISNMNLFKYLQK